MRETILLRWCFLQLRIVASCSVEDDSLNLVRGGGQMDRTVVFNSEFHQREKVRQFSSASISRRDAAQNRLMQLQKIILIITKREEHAHNGWGFNTTGKDDVSVWIERVFESCE